ncbi:hemerythrin domain-containing protein [Microlunatus panaciterrae]
MEELFQQIIAAKHPEERRDLAQQVIVELVRHVATEEHHLYPAVRLMVPDGDQMVDRELNDHARVEALLRELEGLDVSEVDFIGVLVELREEVLAHVREEEGELFPSLRAHTGRDTLQQLGREVRRARKAARATGSVLGRGPRPSDDDLAPGSGLVDRVRYQLEPRSA